MSDGRHIWIPTSIRIEIGVSWVLSARFKVVRDHVGVEVGGFVEVTESTTGSPVGVLESCSNFLRSTCALMSLA